MAGTEAALLDNERVQSFIGGQCLRCQRAGHLCPALLVYSSLTPLDSLAATGGRRRGHCFETHLRRGETN